MSDTTHHLMRVRVRTRVWKQLQDIAAEQTQNTGETTYVSDLVRSALFDYIRVHESTLRFSSQLQKNPRILVTP